MGSIVVCLFRCKPCDGGPNSLAGSREATGDVEGPQIPCKPVLAARIGPQQLQDRATYPITSTLQVQCSGPCYKPICALDPVLTTWGAKVH